MSDIIFNFKNVFYVIHILKKSIVFPKCTIFPITIENTRQSYPYPLEMEKRTLCTTGPAQK